MAQGEPPIGFTPESDGEIEDDETGTVDVDGKHELDGDINEDEVNSADADRRAAEDGEVEDDETGY